MYDLCDVLHSSYCSADITNHVLREYGEGSMGKGIRKLAGEMLTIGGQQSYSAGYESGVADTYPIAFKDGAIMGTVVGICIAGLLGWCAKKIIDRHNTQKADIQVSDELMEEKNDNA